MEEALLREGSWRRRVVVRDRGQLRASFKGDEGDIGDGRDAFRACSSGRRSCVPHSMFFGHFNTMRGTISPAMQIKRSRITSISFIPTICLDGSIREDDPEVGMMNARSDGMAPRDCQPARRGTKRQAVSTASESGSRGMRMVALTPPAGRASRESVPRAPYISCSLCRVFARPIPPRTDGSPTLVAGAGGPLFVTVRTSHPLLVPACTSTRPWPE